MPIRTVPVTEAKARFLELVSGVNERDDEVIITKKGKPAAVLISIEEFESLKESMSVLNSPELMKQISGAETYFKNGGDGASFEKVFGEPVSKPKERSKKQ